MRGSGYLNSKKDVITELGLGKVSKETPPKIRPTTWFSSAQRGSPNPSVKEVSELETLSEFYK